MSSPVSSIPLNSGMPANMRAERKRATTAGPACEETMRRMTGAVRTLLECVGEDPERSGLVDTPARMAKALLFFTKGYEQDLDEVLNDAVFPGE